MKDATYRKAIDDLRAKLADHCMKSNVGVIVPACMEIVLNSITAVAHTDQEQALRATQSLRPMIDYIEGQIRGQH